MKRIIEKYPKKREEKDEESIFHIDDISDFINQL